MPFVGFDLEPGALAPQVAGLAADASREECTMPKTLWCVFKLISKSVILNEVKDPA
jgi:hypothetical protein